MERGTSGNHGIYGFLLFDKEVDQECSGRGASFIDGDFYFGTGANGAALNAVRVGQLDEVGADEGRGFVVATIEELLPLAHHAEKTVVDDGNVDFDFLLHNR